MTPITSRESATIHTLIGTYGMGAVLGCLAKECSSKAKRAGTTEGKANLTDIAGVLAFTAFQARHIVGLR